MPDDRVVQRLRIAATAPRIVAGNQIDPVADFQVGQIVNRPYRVGSRASAGTEELCRDHLDVPVDTNNPGRVSSFPANRASNVGSMVVSRSIVDGIVVVNEIPSVDVVDVAIAVVINSIPGNFVGINPSVSVQIGVSYLKAFIDNSNHDAGRPGEVVGPRLLRMDTKLIGRSSRSRRRSIVTVHAPQTAIGVIGVIADGGRLINVVWLGEHHTLITAKSLQGCSHAEIRINPKQFQPTGSDFLHLISTDHFLELTSGCGPRAFDLGWCGLRYILDQNLVGHIFARKQIRGQQMARLQTLCLQIVWRTPIGSTLDLWPTTGFHDSLPISADSQEHQITSSLTLSDPNSRYGCEFGI